MVSADRPVMAMARGEIENWHSNLGTLWRCEDEGFNMKEILIGFLLFVEK